MNIHATQIATYFRSFEDCSFKLNGADAWRARDIMPLLGYPRWQQFRPVIQRAWHSCAESGEAASHNFLTGDGSRGWEPNEVFRVNPKNSHGGRPSEDVILSRRAAYLVAMNGDPRKEQVAFAQHYFATATRKLEVIQQRMKEASRLEARKRLSETEARFQGVLYEHDVSGPGIAKIRSKGDKVLFGGRDTETMKRLWKIPGKGTRPIADFAPEVIIVAKQLGAAMTTHNTQANNLHGEDAISTEHEANNETIRGGLLKREIVPEALSPEEDIKKVERRHNADVRKLMKPKQPRASVGHQKTQGST